MKMEYQEIVNHIAPCGLNCIKCLAHVDGEIRSHGMALVDSLGPNFSEYAERLSAFEPVFKNFNVFWELLEYLAQGSCSSCREGECAFFACPVKDCIVEKGVDFCFQCAQFPCENPGLTERLTKKWRNNNEEMKRIGVESFFERVKDLPRYL